MAAVRLLAFSPQDEEEIGQQCSREALVSSLERDLQGPRVRATLRGLYDMLVDGESGLHYLCTAAVILLYKRTTTAATDNFAHH